MWVQLVVYFMMIQKNRFGLQKLSHYYFELNDLEINPECITWAKLINEINQSDIAG